MGQSTTQIGGDTYEGNGTYSGTYHGNGSPTPRPTQAPSAASILQQPRRAESNTSRTWEDPEIVASVPSEYRAVTTEQLVPMFQHIARAAKFTAGSAEEKAEIDAARHLGFRLMGTTQGLAIPDAGGINMDMGDGHAYRFSFHGGNKNVTDYVNREVGVLRQAMLASALGQDSGIANPQYPVTGSGATHNYAGERTNAQGERHPTTVSQIR